MRTVEEPRVDLDQLIVTTASLPVSHLTPDFFEDQLRRLDLADDFIEKHILFSDDHYVRNLILRTNRFEMLAMCWKDGQISGVHDHDQSFGVVLVYKGTLTAITYDRVDDRRRPGYAELRALPERVVPEGSILVESVGLIHQFANRQGDGKPLVTIHLYCRPLGECSVFYPEIRRVDRMRLNYDLQDFNCKLYRDLYGKA
jgi:predicted metal-dependent enzyme (double-stranded beta helix superfamily)